MSAIAKIIAYLVVILVGGAFVGPPLYWSAQVGIDAGWLPRSLSVFDFTKYFNRATMLVALATLWPFLRWVGVTRLAELGIRPNATLVRDLVVGLTLGMGGLFLVAAVMLFNGWARFHEPFPTHRIVEAAATACAVSVIEEIFFRGVLFGALRRELSWQRALAFLAPFFAIVHFLKPDPRMGRIEEVAWWSGFELIPHAFWQFSEPILVLKGFLTLLVVGLILGYVVVRTHSLYLAIGLHGGWVFALRSFSLTSSRSATESIWFGRDLTQGLAALLLLAGSALVVAFYLRWRDSAVTSTFPAPG